MSVDFIINLTEVFRNAVLESVFLFVVSGVVCADVRELYIAVRRAECM